MGIIVSVSKAQAVPEYDTMEAVQDALESSLLAAWTTRAELAIDAAVQSLPDGIVTSSDVVKARLVVDKVFSGWPGKAIEDQTRDAVSECYKLSQTVILKKHAGKKGYDVELVFKAEVTPTFNVVDEKAVEYLQNSQVFWIKHRWDVDTREAIEEMAMDEIEGVHGSVAGAALRAKMEKIFGVAAFAEMSQAYWTGVAVNAATTARVTGIINELKELEWSKYVITNPMDERTSDICAELNGKEFPVLEQWDRIQRIVDSDDPEAIKDLHPWHPHDFKDVWKSLGVEVEAGKPITPDAAEVLSRAGFGMPPYHMKCRTTVDIA